MKPHPHRPPRNAQRLQQRAVRPIRRDRPQNVRHGNVSAQARQKYEHYITLAREAARSGDRVEAENFYQHAEHYFRITNGET